MERRHLAGGSRASCAHIIEEGRVRAAFFLFVIFVSGSDPIKRQLACSIPSLSLRVLIQVRSIEDLRGDFNEAGNDVEHRNRTQ